MAWVVSSVCTAVEHSGRAIRLFVDPVDGHLPNRQTITPGRRCLPSLDDGDLAFSGV